MTVPTLLQRTALVCALGALLASGAQAQSLSPEDAEAQGVSLDEKLAAPEASGARALTVCTDDVLLVPNSTTDGVATFDPQTGDLDNPTFIVDPDNLSTPVNALPNFGRNGVLVSDQLDDGVFEYDCDGNFVGQFAPAGGPDPAILDNIRGMAYSPDGSELWVTVGSGVNADAIARFDASGAYLGNFFPNGDNGLDSPFDLLVRDADVLIGTITSDAVYRYDFSGTFLGIFEDPSVSLSFPEQLALAANDNVLVTEFSGANGLYEFSPTGTLVASYGAVTGTRGVYELPNGNFLLSNGSGLSEVTRGDVIVRVIDQANRFIELFEAAPTVGTNVDIEYVSSTEPMRGERVFIAATLDNNESETVRTRVYFTVDYPDGKTRTYSVLSKNVPAGFSGRIDDVKAIRFPIPANAPAGTYTVTLIASADIADGGEIYDTDVFTFDLPPASGAMASAATDAAALVGPPEALALLAPAPNPARGAVSLGYEVAEASDVTVSVYDALGREVAQAASGAHAVGRYAAQVETSELPAGVYVVRLVSGAEVLTGRFTVVR